MAKDAPANIANITDIQTLLFITIPRTFVLSIAFHMHTTLQETINVRTVGIDSLTIANNYSYVRTCKRVIRMNLSRYNYAGTHIASIGQLITSV